MNSCPLSETETVLIGKENCLPSLNEVQGFCCSKLSLKHNLPESSYNCNILDTVLISWGIWL